MHTPCTIGRTLQFDQCRGPAVRALLCIQPPTPQVMRAGHDARANAIGNPGTVDVIANLGCDTQQVSRLYTNTCRVDWMYPHRVVVRYLVQPLGITGACVYERGQAERGNEQIFSTFRIDGRMMDVTANIARDGIFWPAPFFHRD